MTLRLTFSIIFLPSSSPRIDLRRRVQYLASRFGMTLVCCNERPHGSNTAAADAWALCELEHTQTHNYVMSFAYLHNNSIFNYMDNIYITTCSPRHPPHSVPALATSSTPRGRPPPAPRASAARPQTRTLDSGMQHYQLHPVCHVTPPSVERRETPAGNPHPKV